MPNYTFTTLNDPSAPSGTLDPIAVNDLGQVTGTYGNYQALVGFLYSNDTYKVINDPSEAYGTFPTSINDLGQVVGNYENSSDRDGAFLFSGGQITQITDPSSAAATNTVIGINQSAQIAGTYSSVNYSSGFTYLNGVYSDVTDPISTNQTTLTGLNDEGQVIGNVGIQYSSDGFIYSNGTYVNLSNPAGSAFTTAIGINDGGVVVGDSYVSGVIGGYLYENGDYTSINDPQGVDGTIPVGIDNAGDVVGYYFDDNYDSHGFVYTNGVFNDLVAPDGEPALPNGISSSGLIVGTYQGSAGDTVGFLATPEPACFLEGTKIETANGPVEVQLLRIGGLLTTQKNRLAAIRWIGRRSYAGRFLAANPGVQPVRFCAGSLGDGLPRRDLLVSPEHAMFLGGLLIPARCLVNGSTITQERDLNRVDYYHIELDTHDVLLAEGAPSESFLDDDSRGMFHNAREFAALYPDAPESGRFCAPKVDEGYQLEAIRRRLAVVAGEIARAA